MYMKKHLGQHFLHQESILKRIADRVGLTHTETLIEIGPGSGALTEQLLDKCAKLICIEKDADLIPVLQSRFAQQIADRLQAPGTGGIACHFPVESGCHAHVKKCQQCLHDSEQTDETKGFHPEVLDVQGYKSKAHDGSPALPKVVGDKIPFDGHYFLPTCCG